MPSPAVERRRSPRYLCSHLAAILWWDVNGAAHKDTVVLEDLSLEGAAIAVSAAIEPGIVVELVTAWLRTRARVRHCRPREDDFQAGLEFADGTRWQPDVWRPEHLFLPPRE